MDKKNVNMQIFRAVLFIIVFSRHIYGILIYKNDLFLKFPFKIILDANTAVAAFFIISGYYLTDRFVRKVKNMRGIIAFIIHRLLRLVPMAWMSIILAYILCNISKHDINLCVSEWGASFWNENFTIQELIYQLRLFRIFPNSKGLLNPPIWTVMREIKYAIIMPWLLLVDSKIKNNIISNIYVAACITVSTLMFLFSSKGDVLYLFCIGWGLYKFKLVKPNGIYGFILAILVYPVSPIISIVIIIFEILYGKSIVHNESYLLTNILTKIGDNSYIAYLVHFPILLFCRRVLHYESLMINLVYILLCIIGVIIMTTVLTLINKSVILPVVNRLNLFIENKLVCK